MSKKGLHVLGGGGKTPPSDTIVNDNQISMCIDWLTCTFDFIQFNYQNAPHGSWQQRDFKEGLEKLNKLYELLTFPDEDERQFDETNIAGYKHGNITLGEHVRIWFGGALNSNKLYHSKLEMSGQACQDFLSRGGNFIKLLNWLLKNGGKFTRIDAAVDVMTYDYFDMKKLYDHALNYSYVSPMRKWKYIHGGDSSSETFDGETLYFGSESSNTLICIYDKKLEQFNRGIEVMDEAWIRVEIRFKQERAVWFVSEFLNHSSVDNDFRFIAEALFTVLDFKDKVLTDSNKSRWPTCNWWLEFISVASKADFKSKIKIEPTIERKQKWIKNSVAKPLAQLYYYDPINFLINLYDVIYQKSEELDKTDLSMINNKKLKDKLSALTMDDILNQKEALKRIIDAFKENKDVDERE